MTKFAASQEKVKQVSSVCYDKNMFAMIKTIFRDNRVGTGLKST